MGVLEYVNDILVVGFDLSNNVDGWINKNALTFLTLTVRFIGKTFFKTFLKYFSYLKTKQIMSSPII